MPLNRIRHIATTRRFLVPTAVLAMLVCAYLLLISPPGMRLVRRAAESLVNGRIRGRLSLGTLRTNLLSRLSVEGLSLTTGGEAPQEVLRVARVELEYSLPTLLRHGTLKRLYVRAPVCTLIVDEAGVTSLDRLLPPPKGASPSPASFTLPLPDSVRLEHGALYATDLRRDWELRISGVRMDKRPQPSGVWSSGTLRVPAISFASAAFADSGAALSADFEVSPDSLRVTAVRLVTSCGSLEAAGALSRTDLSRVQLSAVLAADLSQLGRCLAAKPPVSGRAEVRAWMASAAGHRAFDVEAAFTDARFPGGHVPDLRLQAHVADSVLTLRRCSGQLNGGTLEMAGTWRLSAARPAHDATITARRVDLSPVLERLAPGSGLSGLLDLDVQLEGEGAAQLLSDAQVNARLSGSRVGARQFGDMRLSGTYHGGRLALSGGLGGIAWRGSGTWGADGVVDLRLDAAVRDTLPFFPLLVIAPRGGASLSARTHGRLPRPQVDAHLQGRSFRVGALVCDSLVADLQVDSAGIAALGVDLNGGEVRLDAGLDLNQGRLLPTRLEITGVDLARRLFLPGSLRVGGLLGGTVAAQGELVRPEASADLHVRDAELQGARWGDLGVQLTLSDSLLSAALVGADSALHAQAVLGLTGGRRVEGALTLEDFPLDPLLRFLRLSQASGVTSLKCALSGPLDDAAKLRGSLLLDTLGVTSGPLSLRTVHGAQLMLRDGRLTVDGLDMLLNEARLSMAGSLATRGSQAFRLDLEPLPLDPFGFATPWGEPLGGRVRGGVRLDGSADTLGLRAEAEWTDVGLLGVDTVDVRVAAQQGKASGTLVCRQAGPGELTAILKFPWPFSLTRPVPRLQEGGADLEVSAQRFEIGALNAFLPRASEHLRVFLHGRANLAGESVDWETWTGELSLDSLRISEAQTVLENLAPVHLGLDHGALTFVALDLGPPSPAQRDSAGSKGRDAVPQIPQVSLSGMASLTGRSDLALTTRGLDLRLPAAFWGAQDRVAGDLDVDVAWSGLAEDPRIAGQWRLAGGSFAGVETDQFTGNLAYAEGRLDLRDVELVLAGQTAYFDGSIPADLRIRKPVGWEAAKGFRLTARAPWLDLSDLPLDIPQLGRLKGQLYVDASMHGTLERPVGEADVRATNLEVKLKSLEDPFSVDRLTVSLDSTGAVLRTHGGRLGGGGLEVSGTVSLQPQTRGVFSVQVHGSKLPVRVSRTVDLTANVDLDWEGRREASLCSGRVEIAGGVFRKPLSAELFAPFRERIEKPRQVPSALLKGARLDIGLLTSRPFEVRTDLVETPLNGSLHIGGTAARPEVLGSIESGEGGYLHYLDRQFVVDRLNLYSKDAYRFAPEVDLHAQAELLDLLNVTPYTVTLDVTGYLPRPTVQLSSDPPLGPLDIMSLMTLGTTQSAIIGGEEGARALITDRSRDLAIQRAVGLTSQQFGRILGTYGINVNAHASDASEWADARIRLDKQLTQRMVIFYTTTVGGSASQRVQVDYKLADHLSLQTQTDENGDSGIDLRLNYRF